MFETVIAVRKPNQKLPKEFIDHLIACGYTAGFGISMAIGGNIKGGAFNGVIDWDTIQGSQSNGVDSVPAVYSFHRCDHDLAVEECMPYTILGPDEAPILVAFGDGACLQHEKMQVSAPPISVGIENVLKPFIAMAYKFSKQNLDLTLENISDEDSNKQIMSDLFGANSVGSLILLANNGVIVPFNNQEKVKDLDWAWISDTLGYGEVKKAATKFNFAMGAAKGPTSSVADKPKVTEAPITAPKEPQKAAPTSVPEIKPEEKKADTSAAELARQAEAARINVRRGMNAAELAKNEPLTVDEHGLIYPPLNLIGKKGELKAWYHKHGGNPHFHEMTKNSSETKWTSVGPGIKPKADGVVVKDFKDLGNHHIPTVQGKAEAVLIGVIPADVKERFIKEFEAKAENKVALDQSSGGIPEPKAFQGFEGEFAKFAEQTGVELGHTLTYTWRAYEEMVKKFPTLAAMLMHEYATLIRSHLADQVKFREPAPVAVPATPAPAPIAKPEPETKQVAAGKSTPTVATNNRRPIFKFANAS